MCDQQYFSLKQSFQEMSYQEMLAHLPMFSCEPSQVDDEGVGFLLRVLVPPNDLLNKIQKEFSCISLCEAKNIDKCEASHIWAFHHDSTARFNKNLYISCISMVYNHHIVRPGANHWWWWWRRSTWGVWSTAAWRRPSGDSIDMGEGGLSLRTSRGRIFQNCSFPSKLGKWGKCRGKNTQVLGQLRCAVRWPGARLMVMLLMQPSNLCPVWQKQ